VSNPATPAPDSLRCEYLTNPLGIDTEAPRFSWLNPSTHGARGQVQSAYQVLVASSREKLSLDVGDLWDSGKVPSDRCANVEYAGSALRSGDTCFWKVRCWDGSDVAGPFSVPATFEMGLLTPDDWQCRWIAADPGISSPLLRRELHLPEYPTRARIYVCGLGYHELFVNGRKIGKSVLNPGSTYYHNDQPFPLNARVLYVTYDVTDHLYEGENAIGVMLGNGWYSAEADIPPAPRHREPYSDRPALLLQANIDLADGCCRHVASGEDWRWAAGPILYNDYSNGETYDARREQPGWNSPGFDDAGWHRASVVAGPNGSLVAQMIPPVEVVQTLQPVRITKLDEETYIADFGQHLSGWTRVRASGPRGTRVTLRHGAELFENGHLDARSNLYNLYCTHIALQTDSYTLKGEGEEVWEPRFTLHGFRYVEIIGYPGELKLEFVEARHVRSAVETSGSFECDSTLLNKIHSNVRWTFASSMQSFPQDAADRSERVGWLGDPIPEDFMLNFDTATFWTKWAADLRDAQKPDGDLPVICPLHWRRTGDFYSDMPVWKSTYPIVVWRMYEFYDDERILAEHYNGIERLVSFLGSRAVGHILETGLGDHMEPQDDGTASFAPRNTPSALTSTAYYFHGIRVLSRAAGVLGRNGETERYRALADAVKTAFNERFLDSATSQYGTGSQTSNAIALLMDLVPEARIPKVMENLLTDIQQHQGHLSTGMLGTNALVQVLPKYGAGDVMYRIATQTTYPGWGYMVERGATTLWETWDGTPETQLSRNMKLFGSIGKFFYREVAGISPSAPGFGRVCIRPRSFGDLRRASAVLRTVRGKVCVAWERTGGAFRLNVTVPGNTDADVHLPKMGTGRVRVSESGRVIWSEGCSRLDEGMRNARVEGIQDGLENDEYVQFRIGSGTYAFVLAPHE